MSAEESKSQWTCGSLICIKAKGRSNWNEGRRWVTYFSAKLFLNAKLCVASAYQSAYLRPLYIEAFSARSIRDSSLIFRSRCRCSDHSNVNWTYENIFRENNPIFGSRRPFTVLLLAVLVWPKNTHHKGKHHCTVDLLFDWFGFSDQSNVNWTSENVFRQKAQKTD